MGNRSFRLAWSSACGAVLLSLIAAGSGAAAQPADTLRVGNWDFPRGLGNPYNGAPVIPQIFIWSAIFDTLTYVNEKGQPTGGIATAWKNVSPTSWNFSIRNGAKYQNGEPVDASSVVKTIEWFRTDPGKASTGGQTFNYITSARAVDGQTVELTTSAPRPILPNQVAALMVVPPRAWADLGVESFSVKPVGSGSYRAVQWSAESVRMEAFSESWRAPKIPKIEFSRIPEPIARRQALVSNQIDIMIQASTDDIDAVKAAGGGVDVVPSPLVLQLAFVLENTKAGLDMAPLKDRRVRQALNYAVNKASINTNLMGGIMGINSQYAVPIAYGYNPDVKPYPYDVAKAKALLTEAGYANGFKMTAEVRDSFDAFQQIAQDLRQVGVTLELTSIVNSDWVGKFQSVKWDTHSFSLTIGVAPEMDAIRPMLFQSCRKTPQYYCNRELMPLVDAADSEFDSTKREKILQELMAKLHDDAPAIFLFELKDLNAYGKRVKGFRNVNRIFNYHEMTLAN